MYNDKQNFVYLLIIYLSVIKLAIKNYDEFNR